jgi:CRISPR-associated protein Cas2
MLVAISYDMKDDKRRTRLAKLLGAHGNRVQYSVFEAHLSEAKLQRLRGKAQRILEPNEDTVRYYRLGEAFEQRVIVDGLGEVTKDLEFVIV